MIREAKEGDRIPGGYVLTGLGATMLNSSRKREARGVRATALEKMAHARKLMYPTEAEQLMKMNQADIESTFGGQRKNLTFGEIEKLKKQEKEDLVITQPRF